MTVKKWSSAEIEKRYTDEALSGSWNPFPKVFVEYSYYDNLRELFTEVSNNWEEYVAYLKDKYPAEDGKEWEFSCLYHKKIDKLLQNKEK